MLQSIPENLKSEVKKISTFLKDGIFPFIERPCDEKLITRKKAEVNQKPTVEKDPCIPKDHVNDASELFSFFTADIIKEDVIFTR